MEPWRSWLARLFSRDRRSAERHVSPPLVAYYWDGGTPSAHGVRDISTGGLYLFTDERWYPGTLVMLRLQRTDTSTYARSERSIAVESKSIRWGPDGVGMKFIFPESSRSRWEYGFPDFLDRADRKALTRFLWRLRGSRFGR